MATPKRILLLGDSIRMSYQSRVVAKLAGSVDVWGPPDNGRFALYTLSRLDTWLAEKGPPDIVHWNNGLWDLGECALRCPAQIPVADYVGNVRHILTRLRQTDAALIWRTTTPVAPDFDWQGDWSFAPADVVRYNVAASALMSEQEVPEHDLHAVIERDLSAYLADDGVHLTAQGQDVAAESVVAAVRPFL